MTWKIWLRKMAAFTVNCSFFYLYFTRLAQMGYCKELNIKYGWYTTIQWIFTIAFGTYIYFRYNFLTNVAPSFAFPAYDAGIHFTGVILKKASLLKAANSKEVIQNLQDTF